MRFVWVTFALVNVTAVAVAVVVAIAIAVGLHVGVSVRVSFVECLMLVPGSLVLLLSVFVSACCLLLVLAVLFLLFVLHVPTIPRASSLALIMLAR